MCPCDTQTQGLLQAGRCATNQPLHPFHTHNTQWLSLPTELLSSCEWASGLDVELHTEGGKTSGALELGDLSYTTHI